MALLSLSRLLLLVIILLGLWRIESKDDNKWIGSTAEHLPYQAHSFNDLNITRNIMLKKTKYFKFDASLANRESCQKYSTWNRKNPCFNSSYYAEEICCIALRGDAGSENNFQFAFNTSQELVRLIQTFVETHNGSIDILFLQYDIQFKFQFKNRIAENALYQMAMLMKKYPKVHITVDGDHILEYDRICRHYNSSSQLSLGDEACSPIRKAISDSQLFLQSGAMHPNDPRDFKGRFRNFNIIYTQIDRLCSEGFPTWQNKYPHYPLIFWEPSNEDLIQSSLRKLFTPACARKHNRTIQGIAFASNIEPEMFQIYMKTINQNERSKQFPWSFTSQKLWLENVKKVKITTLRGVYDEAKTNSHERLVIFWQVQQNGLTINYLSILILNDQNRQINIYKSIVLEQQIVELHSINDKIIGIFSAGDKAQKQFTATIITYNSQLQPLNSKRITNFIISYANDNYLYYLIRTSNPTYFNLYYIESSLNNATQYGVSTYMPHEQINSITSLYFKQGKSIDEDMFFVLGNDAERTRMTQIKFGNVHKSKILTYGINANIIDKYDGNILISLENSYSHGGVLFNNNAENKCQLHKRPEAQYLAHLPTLINVLEGSLQSFVDFFNQDSQQIVTGCHPHITFSKHMNGANSEIASVWDNVIISSQYIPLNKQDLMVTLFSGGSNYEAALRNKTGYMLVGVNGNNRFKSMFDLNMIAQQ